MSIQLISKELQDFFENEKVELVLFPDKTVRPFKVLKSFHEFIIKEKTFWEVITQGQVGHIKNHFESILNGINTALQSNDINSQMNHLRQAISAATRNGVPCIYSITPQAKLIMERYNQNPEQADAVYSYFFENNVNISNNKQRFKGFMFAFFLSDKNEIHGNKINVETLALENLRSNYTKELEKLDNDYNDRYKAINEDHALYQEKLSKWKSDTESKTETFLTEKQESIKELEFLYNEKLRFQSPAKYWDDLSISYENRGKTWRWWSIGSVIIFILFLTVILYFEPNSFMVSNKSFNINSVRGIIVFGLITSIGIYLISLFIKLTTSAFHLSADARERYQITHVYLSLLNEKGISESERSIVLQSIFSRADTGLLKGDSTPTFPDNTFSQLLKGVSGQK